MHTSRHTALFYLAASVGLAVIVTVASTLTDAAPVQTGTPAPGQVVARLNSGGAAYPVGLQDAMAAHRAAPDDPVPALAAARALIAFGRAQGDSRLAGAATGILRPFLASDHPEALFLAATARQYQHDFPGALALLDRAAAAAPQDVNTLLTRATIHTVRGDLAAARADCARIAALPQPAVAFLCQATTHTLTAEGPVWRQRLARITDTPGLLDPALRPWAIGLMAEIALHQGDLTVAEQGLRAVLATDPAAQREGLMLADLLLARGAGEAVLAVLAPLPETDGVLIRRVLALRATGEAAAAADTEQVLSARIRLNRNLGLTAHAREEAAYFLDVAPDPALALARAQVNWALQHEIDDALLLGRAATAAGQPAAAQPVADWMAGAGVIPRRPPQ